MCGRFLFTKTAEDLNKHYQLERQNNSKKDEQLESNKLEKNLNQDTSHLPRFNIASAQYHPVITYDQNYNENIMTYMKWGLVPSWAKEGENKQYNTINAKVETLGEKPAFKKPFASQRCLIPATGFYEWVGESSPKQPYLIELKDQEIISLAGLWDKHVNSETKELEYSFTIITTSAIDPVSKIHERMPVIIDKKYYEQWVKNEVLEYDPMQEIMAGFNYSKLKMSKVSKELNNAVNDSKDLLKYLE